MRTIKHIAIVGGGTAGWMAANILRVHMKRCRITLVESPTISSIRVGEALTPPFHVFLRYLGVHPLEFLRCVQGSVKLAVRFENWSGTGDVYYHPFQDGAGYISKPEFAVLPGYNRLVSYALARNIPLHDLTTSYAVLGAMSKVPWLPDFREKNNYGFGAYSFHMDTSEFARVFADVARRNGVNHVTADVASIEQDGDSGMIKALVLDDGNRVDADLYVDCTGFKHLLISRMGARWESYDKWLPVNAALPFRVGYKKERDAEGRWTDEMIPACTSAKAIDAGWLWCIPLRHMYGMGYVYSDHFCSDDQALEEIRRHVDSSLISNLGRKVRFHCGTFDKNWIKNCVAVGLSSGFIEPLESTSIQISLTQLMSLINILRYEFSFDEKSLEPYNRAIKQEVDDIRDFIILHYATDRNDTPFWSYVKDNKDHLDYPDSVRERIEVAALRTLGHARVQSEHIRGRVFGEMSHLYIMQALKLLSRESAEGDLRQEYDSLDQAFATVGEAVNSVRQQIRQFAGRCMTHRAFLESVDECI